jgi:hypothetical protein
VGGEIDNPAGQVRALQSFGAPNAIVRSVAEMPVMPEVPLRTARTHDQVDRDAFDYTLQMVHLGEER